MKLNIITIQILLMTAVFAGKNTTATDVKVIELPKINQSAFYIGLGASYMTLKDTSTNESLKGLGATVVLGYKYNDFIATEARYSKNIGKVAYNKGNTTFVNNSNFPTTYSNLAIYLKPQYPIGDFNIYGLVGYGMVKYTDLPKGTKDRKESSFQWGLGTEYSIMEDISIFESI